MYIGTIISNIRNNNILVRMKDPVYNEKIEFFLLEFMKGATKKTGVLSRDLYKYIYSFSEENYYILITHPSYSNLKAYKILESLIMYQDPIDLLVAIDNILFDDFVVFPNLSLIKSMDSQEEKIYNMMMKNKELELRRKQKSARSRKLNHLEEIHNKQLELTKKNLEELKIVEKTINEKKSIPITINDTKKRFETSSSPVFICLKERIRCSVDTDNNIKNIEILGDMTVNIKEEAYKSLEVRLKGDYKDCKFSPKLSKDSSATGLVKSDKPFSLNKNIALLKWKDSKIKNLPIEFTFWPSEIKMNTFQISLEFTATSSLENLVITIPKTNLSDVVAENIKETKDTLEWSVGNVCEGDSESLEFQCRCSDPNNIFPVEVYFTSPAVYRNIDVEEVVCNGEKLDCVETKRVLEVDSFKVESE
ncbi:Coatomer subunit delta [Nosema granulosis]|uniref:Coatomer subunit delta n=1 Tax=Nosema granulosis TaxID=83296 RepID=A0A9P6L0W3_9MICR|nr:Coatomer subunit delta [Nosema granulosis]